MTLRAVAPLGSGGSNASLFNSSAFASLPAAASSTGLIYSVSDAGNALFRSDGTIWKPVGGNAVLGSSAAAVSAGADTTEDTLATITIPANIMGPNGTLEIWTTWSFTGSTNAKTCRVRFSGGAGTIIFSHADTTVGNTGFNDVRFLQNRAATNSQFCFSNGNNPFNASTAAHSTLAVDTTAATSVVITGQKASSGEALTIERYLVRLVNP